MARLPRAGDAEGWTKRFLKYQSLQIAAQHRRDIPAANRHVEKVSEALNAPAAAGPEGREVPERPMDDHGPSSRGRAARHPGPGSRPGHFGLDILDPTELPGRLPRWG
ncbi:MAG: hypothetical protein Kow0026_16980 [Oricola sp.]